MSILVHLAPLSITVALSDTRSGVGQLAVSFPSVPCPHHAPSSQGFAGSSRPTEVPEAPRTIPRRVGAIAQQESLVHTLMTQISLRHYKVDARPREPGMPATHYLPTGLWGFCRATQHPQGVTLCSSQRLSQVLPVLEQLEQGGDAWGPCPWEASKLENEECSCCPGPGQSQGQSRARVRWTHAVG